jgi:hypothetical protein
LTLVLGFSSENFSVLAADTRMFIDGKQEDYVDDYVKLHELPETLGWVIGSGFTHVLNNFMSLVYLNAAVLWDYKQIQPIFESTIKAHPNFEEIIETSNIFSSYFNKDEQTQKLHSIVVHYGSKKATMLEKNTYFINTPLGYSEQSIGQLLEKYEMRGIHYDSLDIALLKVTSIFDEISLNTDAVSRTCDIGIQFNTSNELSKQRFTNDAKELKKLFTK